ncbi:MAG: M56 family metallopeptidase [Eubacterium sp.]|nr:M56 family metallopeptidase [Eubacterium sp.]
MFILEMLKFNILAAIVILITLLISRILKNKYSVRWKYWTWLFIAVLLLLPFHFTALRPVIRVNVPRETSAQMADVQETTGGNGTETTGGRGLKAEYDNNAVSNPQQTNAAASGSEEQPVPDEPLNPAENSVPVETMTSEEPLLPAETMKPAETRDTADHPAVDIQASSVSLLELERWFVYVWIAGIAFVFVVRMLQYIAVKRKLGKYRHRVDTQEVLDTYGRLCRKLGIRKPPVLYHQPALQSPLLTGLVKPALYLPGEAYTAVELELIFLHELHHYQHKDLWYKFFLSLSGMIYWFNPAIWLMRREANRDLEALCDSAVIRSAADSQKSRAYGRLLLQTSMERSFLRQAALGLNDSVTDFKERIKYMLSAKNRKSGIAICLLLICVLFSANQLVGCASVSAESRSGQAEASSVESSETLETLRSSVSESEISSVATVSSSTAETSSASLTPAPTVYETEYFTFTLPEIWQGQVTGSIKEDIYGYEYLSLEWQGVSLASISLEEKAYSVAGDIGTSRIWHSEGQNSNYWVCLTVQNIAYYLPTADVRAAAAYSSEYVDRFFKSLSALTDEEKEQVLYLTTGGRVTLENVAEGGAINNTADFYEEYIIPNIEVKELPPREIDTEAVKITTFETRNFSFTMPEIWKGKVSGKLKEMFGFEQLILEWKGIRLATIQVDDVTDDIDVSSSSYDKVWRSEEKNGYRLAIRAANYAFTLGYIEVHDYGAGALDGLTDEDKKELLYLTTGGKLTLEEVTELCSSEETDDQTYVKTCEFYEEYIVPYIEIKELP